MRSASLVREDSLFYFLLIGNFPLPELLPSDRQLVHHEYNLHRCANDQRLLEIPSSCRRIADDNLTKY